MPSPSWRLHPTYGAYQSPFLTLATTHATLLPCLENRKRGKMNKKKAEDEHPSYEIQPADPEPESTGEPSWILAAPLEGPEVPETNPEAPFGYVDADLKAYFRTVDVQMCNWQEHEDQGDQATDPSEGAFSTALHEVQTNLLPDR
ncbi:hypothetical protein DXG01_003468 [Tephrocybe rancida]|nr:hypothetical protein DXG01_003468 [Tephrocybe rancida]